MARMPKGPYTVWRDGGYEGWRFDDYETLEEAVSADTHGETRVITRPVVYEVVEKEPPHA